MIQQKLKTKDGQQGNVLTRSFLMEYNGAQAETGINTPAETWQIDFTARMAAMDERQRLENIDLYGAAAFLGNGYLVAKSGSQYFVTAGAGYVRGLRAQLAANQNITVATTPVKVWLDVAWTGTLTSAWGVASKITVAATLADYVQNGVQHYVFAVASIDASGNITDLRPKGSLNDQSASDALKKHEQSRNHPDATTAAKGFTQLSSALDSVSESLAATPKAVKAANDNANGRVPSGRKINGRALSTDINITAQDIFNGQAVGIGDAADLNTYTTPGLYYQPANAQAQTGKNYPEAVAGSLEVYKHAGITQVYRVYNNSRSYIRTMYSGAWSGWAKQYDTLNKPSPADINAVNKSGDTMTGTLKVNAEVQAASANGFRIAYGDYGTFWRNDGSNLYLMLTNKGDAYGAYNALRPLRVSLETGALQSETPLTVGNTIYASKEITAGYSGIFGWANQYSTKAPFFNSYSTTGASEYHPVIKQQATITGKNAWAFSMGSLVADNVLSWHLHMKGSANGDVNYKWDVNGNFSAPGQITPGNYSNFDGRYYTKTQSDAGYMPKTGAYTKAESDGRFQPKGSYTPAGQAYTKAESDGRFQPKGSYTPAGQAYTKAESDGRYPLKTATVIGVRVSARGSIGSTGGASDVDSPVGSFITGRTGSNGDVRYSVWYTRALQINVNGTWKTITA
ncbi:tail fiber protein [Enterobacter sp. A4]|uniref:pyocin knob domain-containing protein n=1 Tax=Enterobacter TaxID=547 RepID=UPI003D25D92F